MLLDSFQSIKMPKNIIEAYFDEFNMIDFVIDSYNQLLDNIGNTI